MIKVEHLMCGYGGKDVLHDLSFELPKNESLSIIGPNGCGKTTLLRAIAGVLPFRGAITFDDVPIGKLRAKERAKKVAMLSQINQIYFNYSVFDTVMMGRYVYENSGGLAGTSQEDVLQVEKAIETVGLAGKKDCGIQTLSGGQLQRVFLAKLLVQNPDIILLDEPTNHLDLSYQIQLIKFLKEWSAQYNKTIIGVLHDVNLAMLLSDNIMLMDDGYIKCKGESSLVLSSDKFSIAYNMDISGFMLESLKKWQDISKLKVPNEENDFGHTN